MGIARRKKTAAVGWVPAKTAYENIERTFADALAIVTDLVNSIFNSSCTVLNSVMGTF